MDEDDAALLAAARDGSARAFNLLVDRHQQAVRTFLRRLTSLDEAEDLAQETFLAAWTQAGFYRGGASARSWLFGIAWRKAQGAHRKRFRLWRRDAAWREASVDDEIRPAPAEHRIALADALAGLPADQRAALLLVLGFGLTHDEAAAALDLPLGTVKSHVLRGRERLRGMLGDEL